MNKTSKVIFAVFFFAFIVANTFAQDSTKINKNHHSIGLYIAPEFQYGRLGTYDMGLRGASLMFILNQKWAFGATMYSNIKGQRNDFTDVNRFGGLKFEYTWKPTAVIHITVPVIVGAIFTQSTNNFDGTNDIPSGDNQGNLPPDGFGDGNKPVRGQRPPHHDFDDFGRNLTSFAQAGIMAEANFFKYVKVFGGASYRLAIDAYGINKNFNGVSGNIGLKIGVFDYKRPKRK